MVDEKDEKYENLEEGEYHFSDDQLDYDIEPDLPKTPTETAVVSNKVNLLEKFSKNRRALIVTVLLFGLVFIVYKMLMPTSTTPQTDFTQGETAAPATPPEQPTQQVAAPQQPPAPVPQQPVAAVTPPPQPAAPPAPAAQQQVQGPMIAPLPVQQPKGTEFAATSPAGAAPQTLAASTPSVNIQATMPPPVQSSSAPPQMSAPPAPIADQNAVQPKSVIERLGALEQQNAKLASLMQTQYAQKVVDYESQNNEMQQRINTMSKRMANMQATLNQLAQMLQGNGQLAPAPIGVVPPAPPPPLVKTAEPKLTFSVQAIIPGRAWLKSDAGDTVTVAEGDILKGYGRITKIDPYDGIVDIDTGSKVITLSYGMNGDL